MDDGQSEIDSALTRAEQSGSLWRMPELLRMKRDLLLRQGKANDAEVHLERSLAMAHGQGALSWELRSAMILARLHGHDRSRANWTHQSIIDSLRVSRPPTSWRLDG